MNNFHNTRVVLVSPIPPPSGGIATWTLNLLSYWHQKKEFFPHLNLTHVSNARFFGGVTNRSKSFRIFTGVLNFIIFFSRYIYLTGFVKGCQVVHITSSGSFGLLRDILLLMLTKVSGSKVVFHLRFGRLPDLMLSKNWEFYLLNFLLERSNRIIAIDKVTFEILEKKHGKSVTYLPNAVSPMFIRESFRNYPEGKYYSQVPTILFVGHVVKAKGVFDLIRVAGEIGNLRLKIAGISRSSELKEITELRLSYPTLEVDLLGNLTSEQLIKELKSATIFCLPSYTEGFPNAVLEAMALGAPIVASDVGEIPEMVKVNNEIAAWLFKAGDLVGLKKQILIALNDSSGRKINSELCARKVNSMYTTEVVFNQLINVWLNLN
jgi:glycosyltransferase involved in cell wall biosynthesis